MADTRKRTPEEEERWLDAQLAEAYALMGDRPAPKAAPKTEAPLRTARESVPEELPRKKKEKGITGLVILMCLELLGIAAVAGYWLMYLI